MAKKTKAEQLRIRTETYKPSDPNGERCENCRHGRRRSYSASLNCDAIEIRGEIQTMTVHAAGRCDLFQRKEPS